MNKKRNVTKALLGIILSLVLCLTLLPVNIVKAENGSITVYVSISNGGAFETSKDGKTMRYVPVELDGKESYTISDALTVVHDEHYSGGAAEGYSETSSGWLTKLWGDTSGAFGYMLNNVSARSAKDTISDGAHIYAYIYADSHTYSDKYAYFEAPTAQADTGDDLELLLTATGYDATFNTVTGVCSKAQIFVDGVKRDGTVTDSDGKVKLSFDAPGTYIVTAEETGEVNGEESFIVPAFCIVTVTAKTNPGTEPGTDPGKDPATDPGKDPATDPGKDPATDPGKDPAANPGKDPAADPGKDPEANPGKEPDQTPAFPVLDKSVSETVSWGIDNCSRYMQALYGDNIGYGYEWYVFNMLRAGNNISKDTLDKYYESVTAEVSKWDNTKKPTDIARTALALSAMGKDVTRVGEKNLAAMLYNHPELNKGSNELAYALLALDAKNVSIPDNAKWNRDNIIAALLGYQCADGGFGLFDNSQASVDMTAIILQSLAPYYNSSAEVKNAVDAGLAYLKSKMSANYDFDNNSNSTAVVLMALNALGIDPTIEKNGFGTADNNIVTALYGYRVTDGDGYRYMLGEDANAYATIQVMQALTGYRMLRDNQGSYWIISDTIKPVDKSVNTGDDAFVGELGLVMLLSAMALVAFGKKAKKEN